MRAVFLISLAVSCPAFELKAPNLVTDISSDSAGDDNSVFAAEEAMQHRFALTSKGSQKTPTNVSVSSPTPRSAAISGFAIVSTTSQPKAVSWQAQRSAVTKMAVDAKAKLRAEHKQRRAAESEASRLRVLLRKDITSQSAAEDVIRSKLGSKALEDLRLDDEKELGSKTVEDAHMIFPLDNELATKGELAKQQGDRHEQQANGQLVADTPRQSASDDIDAEVTKAHLELQAVAVELNSSKEALLSKTRSLSAALTSLHSEEIRREAAEKASEGEALSLRQTRAEALREAAALAATNATLAETAAELRTTRAQLQSVAAAKASEAAQTAASLRSELQASRAESEELRQKLGRVVQMVQSDLADKDRQAGELIDTEHAKTKKARTDLAKKQRELKESRTRLAELAEENYKLRALASPGER